MTEEPQNPLDPTLGPLAEVAGAQDANLADSESTEGHAAGAEDATAGPVAEEAAVAEVDLDDVLPDDAVIQEFSATPRGPVEEAVDEDEDLSMDWYILKVQSNRERSIAASLQRKVAIEGLDRFFGEIMVPTEKVTEFKAGKKKVVERKLWPGYIAVQMHVNDSTWFAIRETSGIGDFTGAAGKPTPMGAAEIAKILPRTEQQTDEAPKLDIKFAVGDKVKVKDGNFENFEGEVGTIDTQSGKVTIMISIFGRSTPVELEYWQVEGV